MSGENLLSQISDGGSLGQNCINAKLFQLLNPVIKLYRYGEASHNVALLLLLQKSVALADICIGK